MPSGFNATDQKLPAAERMQIIVERQLNLTLNKPGHPPQKRAQMMRKNQHILNDLFQKAWGGTLT